MTCAQKVSYSIFHFSQKIILILCLWKEANFKFIENFQFIFLYIFNKKLTKTPTLLMTNATYLSKHNAMWLFVNVSKYFLLMDKSIAQNSHGIGKFFEHVEAKLLQHISLFVCYPGLSNMAYTKILYSGNFRMMIKYPMDILRRPQNFAKSSPYFCPL